MKRYSSFTLAFALALLVLSVWAVFAPTIRRAAAFDGDAYAIKGGTVVTVTGATIQKGTVIIRNGLIEAVGADIPIPGDARVDSRARRSRRRPASPAGSSGPRSNWRQRRPTNAHAQRSKP